MNAAVVYVVLGGLAASIVLSLAAARLLRRLRVDREAAGEHAADDPEHLGDPASLAALPHIGVHFDSGAGRWVPPSSLDPIAPDDERLLALIRDQRPTLPTPRDPAQED